MDTCEHCTEQLLDYLYELLDEAEADRVRAHLDHCAACQARLAEAEGQQQLFARAARMYQKVPAFRPPAAAPSLHVHSSSADTVTLGQDTVVERPAAPRPVPSRKSSRLVPWLSLAASLLV